MQTTDYYNKVHKYVLESIEKLQKCADKLGIRPQGDVIQSQLNCMKVFLEFLESNNPCHDLQ